MSPNSLKSWSETTTATFLDRGKTYAPQQELQIEIIEGLLKSQPDDMRIVESCPDEEHLTAVLLKRFLTSRVRALGRSEAMWASTGHGAGSNVNRLKVRDSDLLHHDWHGFDGGPLNAVVALFTIHHLEGAGKFHFFEDLFAALAPGGIFVLADLTEPPSRVGR